MVKIIFSLLKIGVICFGGGSALISVIEKEITESKAVISKEEHGEEVIIKI
ncbi:MAG: chromate transporter [Lachnospirales bacterium]